MVAFFETKYKKKLCAFKYSYKTIVSMYFLISDPDFFRRERKQFMKQKRTMSVKQGKSPNRKVFDPRKLEHAFTSFLQCVQHGYNKHS